MKKLLCAVIIIAMMFAACACAQTADPIVPEITDEDLYAVEVEEDHWPVIEGTAAFLPYYTAAAARMLDTGEAEASRSVLCTLSDLAYSDLISGSADLIFCFLPNEQQVRLADAEGVTLACYPVLNEAFVFFVTPDNPVDSLTAQQLRDVYTGAVKDWSELGGKEGPIVPFYRPEGFSDFAGLTVFVADSASLVPAPVQTKEGSMGESAEVAANFDGSAGAIGCGYLSAVLQQYKDTDLKILAVDGCEASAANIQSGAYPFISQACAVIRGGEEESPAGQLAQWCAWPLGQALASEKGYVPNMEVDATYVEE
ncbi:MAG: substrate-binding domain-containing protein, partial [Firmicutes bacterium]|nr:substrate-binding domain-containing protein [Bacillota bacterium]